MAKVIKFLLLFYFISFPFGQLTRLPLPIIAPEVHLYLTDLILGLLVLFWLGWRFIFNRKPYLRPSLAKPIGLFFLMATFSLITNAYRLSSEEIFVSGLYLVRWWFYAGLYFVIGDLKWKGRPFLIWAGAATAGFGLIQYFFWPDIRPLQTGGWDPHYYRVVGTLLDPGFTGIILVLTLILLVVFNWKKIIRPGAKNIKFYAFIFMVYAVLALTFSRSSYLAYLTGMGLIALVKKAPQFFITVVLVGILTFLVLPRQSGGEGVNLQRQSTINARLANWRQSIEVVVASPLTGVGFNAYRYVQRDYGFLGADWRTTHAGTGADASLLFVWATTGILGLLAYLGLWVKAASTKSLILISSIMALFVHAFFLNSFFYPWVMGWMWTLLATENS